MSRVGRQPIAVPERVEVRIEGTRVVVKGPKGEMSREFDPEIAIRQEDGQLGFVSSGRRGRVGKPLQAQRRRERTTSVQTVSSQHQRRLVTGSRVKIPSRHFGQLQHVVVDGIQGEADHPVSRYLRDFQQVGRPHAARRLRRGSSVGGETKAGGKSQDRQPNQRRSQNSHISSLLNGFRDVRQRTIRLGLAQQGGAR